MITEINIKNFKSIVDLTLPLSNFNVLIGENGSGKSNVLEAIAWVSLENTGIDNASLYSKGIRNAKPNLIFNSFKEKKKKEVVEFNVGRNGQVAKFTFKPSSASKSEIPKWKQTTTVADFRLLIGRIKEKHAENHEIKTSQQFLNQIVESVMQDIKDYPEIKDEMDFRSWLANYIDQFLIYSPFTLSLRGLQTESYKEPLGIYGENLDVLLASFSKEELTKLESSYNNLISWLDDFSIDEKDELKLKGFKMGRSSSKLYFKDRFMSKGRNVFSAENANEGVLYVLFYLALFTSKQTPTFFAIDNIETALNPKLGRTLVKILSQIAIENNKQVIITTHNPAILDGLNLHDDRQRLLVVKRNDEGHTKIERIKLKPATNGEQLKLSEMWMRGYLGGLPTNF